MLLTLAMLLLILVQTAAATAATATTEGAAAPPTTAPAPSPLWSVRMADSILARSPDPGTLEKTAGKWSYSTAFVVHAVARVSERTGDPRYVAYARRYFDVFLDDNGAITTPTYEPRTFKLDDVAPGRLALELARATGQPKYRRTADILIEQLRHQPRTSDRGFWHKQVYPHQMWLDGIYMACPFMAEYGRAAGDGAWFDEAAHQMLTIAKHTRDEKTGLYYHGWDESRSQKWADPKTGLSKCFWGRAVGWYVMGIIETLDAMPADHPRRGEVVALFRSLCDAIVKVQDPSSGVWYQVLDQGTREGNYLESSASAMFVFAMLKGSRLGVLDAAHATAARRGYDGILKQFVRQDPATGQYSLTDTCQVAGLGGKDVRDGTFEYYMSEPRVSNDPKGLAPFIFASLELEAANTATAAPAGAAGR